MIVVYSESVDPLDSLILDLIEWVGLRERTYEETMSAWRTSCPRLPVWEDAIDRGLITTDHSVVRVTELGRAHLAKCGRSAPPTVAAR